MDAVRANEYGASDERAVSTGDLDSFVAEVNRADSLLELDSFLVF